MALMNKDGKLQKKAVDANVLLSWQDKHQSATDVEPRQRSSRLGRLAAKLFGISNEGRLSHDSQAPLGYNDNGEPKKVTPVTVIDPDGEKPTETRYLKNW